MATALARACLRSRLSDAEYYGFKPEHIDQLARAGFTDVTSFENVSMLSAPVTAWARVLPGFWAGIYTLVLRFAPPGKYPRPGDSVHSVAGKLDWRNGRVGKLLELYGSRCQAARTVSDCKDRAPTAPLPDDQLDYDNLGKYFSIVGRKSTLHAIMSANISIFQTFRKSSEQMASEDFLKQTLLTSVIAFHGAGKTSLSRCLGRLWAHRLRKDGWSKMEKMYYSVVGTRDEEGFRQWQKMVKGSLTFEFVMYHSVVVDGGGPLEEEKGMSSTNILALRMLHGALIRTVEGDAYRYRSELEEKAPGLRKWITLDDVVEFIRLALDIPTEQKLMLTWFFDGLNRAQREQKNVPSFMQAALGVYAEWMDARRDSNTFVTFLVGTNRYQVATLADTSSVKVVSVPMQPLHQARHYQKVYKIFVSRLRRSVNSKKDDNDAGPVTISSEMDMLLQLAGGNPQLLSYVLQACATSRMSRADYLKLLEGEIVDSYMKDVMSRLWSLASPHYYNGYKVNTKFPHVFRVVQATLFEHKVARSERVLGDGSAEDTWGDLEAAGVIGFVQEQAYITTHEEPSNRVVLSPLILHNVFTKESHNPDHKSNIGTLIECCIIGAGNPDSSSAVSLSSMRHIAKFCKRSYVTSSCDVNKRSKF